MNLAHSNIEIKTVVINLRGKLKDEYLLGSNEEGGKIIFQKLWVCYEGPRVISMGVEAGKTVATRFIYLIHCVPLT